MQIGIIASHPIQYYAPLFRELAKRVNLTVFYAHRASATEQAAAGFGTAFEWDVDLFSGYPFEFLNNVSKNPGPSLFWGSDTPEIADKLRAGRFDAVLVIGWYLRSFLQAIWAAKRLGIPVMVRGDSHLSTPGSKIKKLAKELVFPRFLRVFDAALYVGHYSREYYLHYGYPEERLFFSPHCVDNDWFRTRATPEARQHLRGKLGIDPSVTVLLFAGKLVPFKRPWGVIEAAAKRRAQGARIEVMIAGAGELEAQLRQQAKTLSVPLHFLGFRNQTEMPEAYAAADILVLPSGRETWGLVANEALACSRPIIVSDACGCARDLAANGIAGRSFKTADIDDLSRCVLDVIASPPPAETIFALSKRYSLSSAADGVLEALKSVRS